MRLPSLAFADESVCFEPTTRTPRRTFVKTLTATLCGVLLTAGTVALLPATAEAAVVCQGRAATMVASGSGVFTATEGDDVIVADGGRLRIRALGGNDVVCLHHIRTVVEVEAGAGDDLVDATRTDAPTVASLGQGADAFAGGPGDDFVYGSAPEGLGEDGLNPPDIETDVITTGGGKDQVFSGALGSANLDVIATGVGDDRVHLAGADHATSLDVGNGRNTAIVTLEAADTKVWQVDLGRRTLRFDGQTSTWAGRLHRWYLTLADGQAPSSLVFFGSKADDTAFVGGPGLVPQFRLGYGDDWAGSLTTPGGTFLLGPGLDRLTLGKYDSVHPGFPLSDLRVDLAAQRATFGYIDSLVRGVETLYAGAVRVRALGSARGERIRANGCDVVVRGRAGWDLLERGDDVVSICPDLSSVIAGGAGNDLLLGSNRTDDFLLGGPGLDRARGMRGIDTCRAEWRRSCER
jgi:RTX calcium-binding nonapeptide repeat (4 copies)